MDGGIDLEIPLSHFLNVANFKKLVDLSAEKGRLVREGVVTEWSFSGIRYREGRPLLSGPPARGVPLGAALERPRAEALAAAAAVVRALALVEGAEDAIEIFPESVWLLDDGGILFLPAEVFRKIRLLSDDAYKARCSRLNDPYADRPRERLSHSIGVLLYRVLSGAYPYDGKDLDEIHARIRRRKVLPPRLAFPELKEEVSDLFRRFFEKKLPLSPADWVRLLDGWLADGFTEALSAEEAAGIAARREKLTARLDRNVKRGVFLEKHAKTIAIAVAGAVAAGVAAAFIVSNALRPRLTAGFAPRQVVEAYYRAIDTLDPNLMQDCLRGDAGAAELRRAEMLFVNNRQLEYLTRRSYRLSAGDWDRLGRPPVAQPSYVDGVAALVVRELSAGSEPVFEAGYERWITLSEGAGPAGVVYQEGFRVRDRLTLARDDRDWLIVKIEQLENTMFYKSDAGYQPK